MTVKHISLSPAKKQSALLPGSAEKSADGSDAALNVSVVSPLLQQLLKKAAEEAGSAAEKIRRKRINTILFASLKIFNFFPEVMESLGGCLRDGADVVAKL